MSYVTLKVKLQKKFWFLLLFSLLNIFLNASASSAQTVTIYENANFQGNGKTFGIGEHRLSDFNDAASSIKIPNGLGVVIYEHADEAGGYGTSVDLLEDQPDFSRFNFNDKTSYIAVFSTVRPNYYWARNSIKNGQFVPGHWERARAAGNPPNSVPVVSPPLPPRGGVSARETILQVNGGDSVVASLAKQTTADAATWERAVTDLMGVIGSDYRGVEEIGSAAFQRASNNIAIPDNINFWYPQKQPRDNRRIVYYKRTLTGIIDEIERPYIVDITGTYEDADFTLNVIPAPKYKYLITDAHPPEQSVLQAGKTLLAERENPYGDCDKPFTKVHTEIDSVPRVKKTLDYLVSSRAGKQIAVYGPWIYDRGHCHQPEIHPAEQIWWSAQIRTIKQYFFSLISDASQRFWWRKQMDDGTKLRPWAAPPVKGTFAIAFETEIGKPTKTFTVNNIDHHNVAYYPNSNKTYNLVYQNNPLISFVPRNDAFKVSFEKVGLKPGTTDVVRGFLVLETSVGSVKQIKSGRIYSAGIPPYFDVPNPADPDKVDQRIESEVFKKEAGHYLFTVTLTDPENPDYCVQERLNLNKLKADLKTAEEARRRLLEEYRNAPASQKPAFRQELEESAAEIGRIKEQIKQAQQILLECESRR